MQQYSKPQTLFFTLVFGIFVGQTLSIKWLALNDLKENFVWNSESCDKATSSGILEQRQGKACNDFPDVMQVLKQAAADTSSLCQSFFRNRRWNCSSITRAPNFSPDLTTGTKEQAFVYAMSAATTVWHLARACSLGKIASCSCAKLPKRELITVASAFTSPPRGIRTRLPKNFHPPTQQNLFKWGGCSDDVKSAYRIAKKFFQASALSDGNRPYRKFLQAMNTHNNRAGQKAVEQSLTLECKCHGVSGSCSVRTCWRGLASSKPIAAGLRLFREYTSASQVKLTSTGRLAPIYYDTSLLFTNKGSDYCLPDKRKGSLGTQGRQCSTNSSGTNYSPCKYLCCGRGHVTRSIEVLERCACKFVNCCYVKCKTCRSVVTTHECV